MGQSGADQSWCSRVLPIIDEGSESEPETGLETCSKSMEKTVASVGTTVAERRNVIVARMRELVRRAVAQSSSATPQFTVAATARKWKVIDRSLSDC